MYGDKDLEDFEMYTNLDGSEIGEVCGLLLQLSRYRNYISDEFQKAVEVEILYQLENFREYSEIITSTETYSREVKTLEWI
jgi:hypothetical protein